ncbi:hypothetical protein J7F02_28385 [Streptomyces sp. ISL-112]|uniref:hypothetical protein n=1 Tax=unclassified Streptomyces TaxID=2593676 RepID=UPI001BE74090|nr:MULTISPECIES: hypothetical protein [unclassified Streptomyces]MBT2429429.1 hypothetical protein [Streptomyces sp. ISL-112]MBT2464021.1 hypothetical protein [Streptomyces sp. ISL-63]
MSPYVSSVTDLFSGGLATVSAEIRELRAALLTSDVQVTWEEAEGLSPGEIVTRYVTARRDRGMRYWLRTLAAEYDAGNPFGPRLVDELDGIDGVHTLAS